MAIVLSLIILLSGPKHYIPPGWIYHGESDGYRYYIGCAGELHFLLAVVSGRLAMRFFSSRAFIRPNIHRHVTFSMAIVLSLIILLSGPKHYIPPGWIYHGESDGYRYYIGCAGE
ncbi:hypothetical protein WUBG_16384, partial [Wuchereria bancrofti]